MYKNILLQFAVLFLALLSCGTFLGAQEMPESQGNVAEDDPAAALPPEEEGSTAPEIQPAAAYKLKTVDMNRRITVDLRNMDVVDALAYLALRSGMNIVTSKNVTGRVTFQLKDVPLQDIFDVTLLSNNLAYEKRGEIIYVLSDKEYEDRHGKAFSDAREVKVFHLNYAIPTKAFDLLDTLKSKVGRILVDQETGTVLLMDTPDRIKEMEESLMILEQRNNTQIFNLQYAQAQAVEEKLKAQLDNKSVGSIWADERNNQVIVQTLPERMDDIVRLIEAMDQKTKEVLIDVKIVKIKLNNELTAGFEWEGMFQELTMGGFLGSHPLQPVERVGQTFIDDFTKIQPEDSNPAAGSKTNFFEKLYFGKVDRTHSFEVLLKFLKTLGETRLLSNPKLAVINNQEARIHIGRKEAYVTTTTTTGQTTTTTAEDVTFVDVGIQLSVTPTINDDGYISLQIKPEISSVVDVLTTPSGNEIPIIDTSLAETTVLVKDSSTIIIGGLRREEETESSEGLPIFSQIPVLGNLFTSKKKTRERSELLVMITPRIVSGDILTNTGDIEMAQPNTKSYREYNSFEVAEPEPAELRLKPYRD